MNSKDKSKKQNKRRRPLRYWLFDFVKVTGAIPSLCCVRPRILYENAAAKKHVKGKGVIISNHIGMLDPIILLCVFYYRRISFLAAKEIFDKKIGEWFFKRVQCIPVDRDNFSMQTFKACMDVLDRNKLLGIFPEGAINTAADTTAVAPFKSGSVMMAVRGRAPVIPVYIAPRKKWYERVVCVLGEPIDVAARVRDGFDMNTVDSLCQELHDKEIKLKEVYDLWKATRNKRSK